MASVFDGFTPTPNSLVGVNAAGQPVSVTDGGNPSKQVQGGDNSPVFALATPIQTASSGPPALADFTGVGLGDSGTIIHRDTTANVYYLAVRINSTTFKKVALS